MRIFGLGLRPLAFSFTALATSATVLLAPSAATAQRNSRRTAHRVPGANAASAATPRCASDCGDYKLTVVSALLPAQRSGASGAAAGEVVTLVIENTGTAPAPASLVSVAPRTRLAASRMSSLPPLAPGERVTVQLPVETGPDGTQCVSITLSPAPTQDPAKVQVLASSATLQSDNAAEAQSPSELWKPSAPFGVQLPELQGLPPLPELPYWPDATSIPSFDAGNHRIASGSSFFNVADVV